MDLGLREYHRKKKGRGPYHQFSHKDTFYPRPPEDKTVERRKRGGLLKIGSY